MCISFLKSLEGGSQFLLIRRVLDKTGIKAVSSFSLENLKDIHIVEPVSLTSIKTHH